MNWIKERLKELRPKGKNQTGLGRALGLDPARVTEIIKGSRQIKIPEIPKLAEYLELGMHDVFTAIGGPIADFHGWPRPPEEASDQPLPETNAVVAADAPPLPRLGSMSKDVPVYGTAQGGEGDADFEMNGQIVDWVRRPPRIAGRRDVFALYLQGRSMWPWRDSGQLVYVERARAPKPLDFVVVEMKPREPDDVRPALVKRLISITPTKVNLEQFNPAKPIEIDSRKILRMYRVMDWDELLGV